MSISCHHVHTHTQLKELDERNAGVKFYLEIKNNFITIKLLEIKAKQKYKKVVNQTRM